MDGSLIVSIFNVNSALIKLKFLYTLPSLPIIYRWSNHNRTYECECLIGDTSQDWLEEKVADCEEMNGTAVGNFCGEHVPSSDVFLMSVVLMLGTFTIAFSLKKSKNTPYFPTIVS